MGVVRLIIQADILLSGDQNLSDIWTLQDGNYSTLTGVFYGGAGSQPRASISLIKKPIGRGE